MKYIGFVLLFFTHSAFAQNDFGNDENRQSFTLFPTVQIVRLIKVNDGIRPIVFDSLTQKYIGVMKAVTADWRSNQSHKFSDSTRLVKVDSLDVSFQYGNGTWGKQNVGTALFLILPDTLSYVAIFPDKGLYTTHFSREMKALGSAYDGRDTKIRGMDSMIDQKYLPEILREYLPHPRKVETNSK